MSGVWRSVPPSRTNEIGLNRFEGGHGHSSGHGQSQGRRLSHWHSPGHSQIHGHSHGY